MNKYIGCKLIEAEKGNRSAVYPVLTGKMDEEGYVVKYPDGYVSWSPKEVFEKAYLKVDDNKNLPSGVSIGADMVEDFIAYYESITMGECTTVVRCVLRNGFELIESSACVDPKNYSEKMGTEICMKKIRDKVWELLGFLLQTAYHGMK